MPRGWSRYAEAEHQQRLWHPNCDRANMAQWFDASCRPSITCDTSSNVTDWRDLAGGTTATQAASASERPTYSQSRWYGGPAIYFTDDQLIGTVSITTNQLTIAMAVMMESTSDSNGRFISYSAAIDGEDFDNQNRTGIARSSLSTTLFQSARGTDMDFTHAGLSIRQIVVVQHDNTNMDAYVNGVFQATQAETGSFAITNFRIGGARGTTFSSQLTGEIAEMVMDKGTASTRRRQRIEGYLAHHCWNRYGVDNPLPGSHPFKSTPPLIGA